MPEIVIGIDTVTNERITIGDRERYGGFYVLGKPQFGKSHLLISMALQDITHGHGLLFIDPHIDAIRAILDRMTPERAKDVILLDPATPGRAFAINPLYCSHPDNLDEQLLSFAQARDVFAKVFDTGDAQQGVWLRKYLLNSLYPLIENPGSTLYDLWEFLTEKDFRDALLANVKYHPEIVKFWHEGFDRLPRRDRDLQVQSVLTRIDMLRANHVSKYIISQAKPTVDFIEVLRENKIVLLRIPPRLDEESRSFIGTLVLSQFLKAITLRAEVVANLRTPFAVYVDEMQTFATSDFAKMFTQTGKFKLMPHGAHQVREGQLKPDDPTGGATLVAPSKVCFGLADPDSTVFARELSKDSPTEIRLERRPGISQEPFRDLLHGHKHPDIHRFMQHYLQPMQFELEDTEADMKGEELLHKILTDTAAVLRVDYTAARDARLPGGDVVALQEVQSALFQAGTHAQNLASLFESARGLRLSVRSLNTFLTAIMEGRIVPEAGDELFCHFLLAFVRQSVWVPQKAVPAFEVYVSLTYGNQRLPRPIPMSIAAKYLDGAHEELYREVEAQYTRRVLASVEQNHRVWGEIKGDERQDHYERALKEIMTWKHLVPCRSGGINPLLCYKEVRAFLTPYLFAKFALPWYYDHPVSRPADLNVEDADDVPPKTHPSQEFARQYGEGASVVDALLAAACGQRATNDNDVIPRVTPQFKTLGLWGVEQAVPWLYYGYPSHLRMMELPAIAGMEPFHVWQAVKQLNELLYNLAVPDKYGTRTIDGHPVDSPAYHNLRLDVRMDAQLLLAKIEGDEEDFPDAATLRSWWPWITPYEVRVIGRRRNLLAWKVVNHHSYRGDWAKARGEVRQRLKEYKDEKRNGTFGVKQKALVENSAGLPDLPLPSQLAPVWHGLDEQTHTYLIARACDLVNYGEVVADRTFPQPTLPGISTEQVTAMVTSLMTLLLEAQEEVNAYHKRTWQRVKEQILTEMLWKSDGLLRLQVYQYEGRVHMRHVVERYHKARVFTTAERDTLLKACRKELEDNNARTALAALDDWVQFCQLLAQPENHVRGLTAQYVEREVNTYTTREMIEQMARELTRLQPRTAYVHLLQASGEEQVIRQAKIRTLPLENPHGLPLEAEIQQHSFDRVYRTYEVIEAEISERQDRWRVRAIGNPPPPAEEPSSTRTRVSKPPEPEEQPRKRPNNTAPKAAKRIQVPRKRGR